MGRELDGDLGLLCCFESKDHRTDTRVSHSNFAFAPQLVVPLIIHWMHFGLSAFYDDDFVWKKRDKGRVACREREQQ